MLYRKIKLNFKYGPMDRFYRSVLIKGNPNLLELGTYFATLVGTAIEHCFLITCGKKVSYVMAPFMEDPDDNYKYLLNYSLDDLPSKFCFEYDTGEGWDFDCTVYKLPIEMDSNKNIILLDGKGQGVWEDNIGSLYALFDGEIDPECTEEDDDRGIYKPWNYGIEKFGDFDKPLNIEEINENLNQKCIRNYFEMLKNEKQYCQDCGLPLTGFEILDDFMDNHSDEFDEEFDDEIDEMIEELVPTIGKHIKMYDFVKKGYEELKAYILARDAKKVLASILLEYIIDMEKNNESFDEKKYEKYIIDGVKENISEM